MYAARSCVIVFILLLLSRLFLNRRKRGMPCPLCQFPSSRATCVQLESGISQIRSEYFSLPLTMITHRHRKPSEWGQNTEDLMRLHQSRVGWVRAWKNESECNADWLNFGLIWGGKPIGKNCACCPATMRVLESVPGVEIAGFSLLRAHGQIDAHTDKLHADNRTFHLGVHIPGSSFLAVEDSYTPEDRKKVRWIYHAVGHAFCFDSRERHWAVNEASADRVVLYVDVRVR